MEIFGNCLSMDGTTISYFQENFNRLKTYPTEINIVNIRTLDHKNVIEVLRWIDWSKVTELKIFFMDHDAAVFNVFLDNFKVNQSITSLKIRCISNVDLSPFFELVSQNRV